MTEKFDNTKKFEAHFGFVVVYGGTDRFNHRHTAYKILASTPQDVLDAMKTWTSYGSSSGTPIVPNKYFVGLLDAIFSVDNGTWEDRVNITRHKTTGEVLVENKFRYVKGSSYPVDTIDVKTTGCGAWGISFYPAFADTLEEHESAYKAKCEEEKQERIRKSQEEKELRLKSMGVIRRGWYSVMMTFHCYYWNERRNEMQWGQKNFSGQVIANSQIDAYNKACHDIETNTDPSDGQGFKFPDPTNQSMFDAYFLGMKTDDGYSIEKWEEFSNTEEYKESVK